jgi:hypothetical protein
MHSRWRTWHRVVCTALTVNPKVGRAEALRRSMLALIDRGELDEAHPAYWARLWWWVRRMPRPTDWLALSAIQAACCMTKTLSLLAAALLAIALQFSAQTAEAGRGRGIGLGIAAGVATAIIISQAARAEGRRRGGYCARLLDRCDYGEDWACRRFHYRCE